MFIKDGEVGLLPLIVYNHSMGQDNECRRWFSMSESKTNFKFILHFTFPHSLHQSNTSIVIKISCVVYDFPVTELKEWVSAFQNLKATKHTLKQQNHHVSDSVSPKQRQGLLNLD